MIRRGLIPVAMIFALAGPAIGSELCTGIDQVTATLRTGDAPGNTFGADQCRLATELDGARSYHCFWHHPFREPEAHGRFVVLRQGIDACLGRDAVVSQDQPVNHPDTYDQVAFEDAERTVRLSLKDKAALGRTLVHLSVSTVASGN